MNFANTCQEKSYLIVRINIKNVKMIEILSNFEQTIAAKCELK